MSQKNRKLVQYMCASVDILEVEDIRWETRILSFE